MNIFKKIFLLTLLLIVIIIPQNVYAQKCNESQTKEFENMVKNIKIEYVHDKGNKFKIKMANIPKEILIVDNNGTNFTYKSNNVSVNDGYIGGETYQFKFLPVYYNCELDIEYTKTVKIGKYNQFSEKEECKKYKDFKYCQTSLNTSITEDEFYQELDKYKSKVNKPKYIFLSICSVNLIALIIIYFIIIRKRKKEENLINDFIK